MGKRATLALSEETKTAIRESLVRLDRVLEKIDETNPAAREGHQRAKDLLAARAAQREAESGNPSL